ncbi:hypothetical protein ACFQL7_20715 [Halocatena marina]|uniref:Uncharacterized protein n=1 Tax=Halocatena marina TaxID=2934937 RepID=A0ABD5YXB9_9EURY|nr:hypothetical protein [Halocatena marina]
MSKWDGEPEFEEDAAITARNINSALENLTQIPAYVLSADEMEEFKQAQMALRELHHGFEEYYNE